MPLGSRSVGASRIGSGTQLPPPPSRPLVVAVPTPSPIALASSNSCRVIAVADLVRLDLDAGVRLLVVEELVDERLRGTSGARY